MKALGLTNTQFLIAVIFGLLIAFVNVAATAPHPVEVPVQVITPVPTPPPVVIGSSSPEPVAPVDEGIPWWIYSLALILMIAIMGGMFYVATRDIATMADVDDNPFNTAMDTTMNTMTNVFAFTMLFALVAIGVYLIGKGIEVK